MLLASYGIIAVSFSEAVLPGDLRKFNRIISLPRNEIWEAGGIAAFFADAGVCGIKVQAIDPSVFTLTDDYGADDPDSPVDPWDIFVRKLLAGYFSISREMLMQLLAAPPSDLAREFDFILAGIPEEARSQTFKPSPISSHGTCPSAGSIEPCTKRPLDKICAFVAGLSPQMRIDFIVNICRSTTIHDRFQRTADPESFPAMISPGHGVHCIPRRFHAGDAPHAHAAPLFPFRLDPGTRRRHHDENAAEKVRVLFRKAETGRICPPDYRETLMSDTLHRQAARCGTAGLETICAKPWMPTAWRQKLPISSPRS